MKSNHKIQVFQSYSIINVKIVTTQHLRNKFSLRQINYQMMRKIAIIVNTNFIKKSNYKCTSLMLYKKKDQCFIKSTVSRQLLQSLS